MEFEDFMTNERVGKLFLDLATARACLGGAHDFALAWEESLIRPRRPRAGGTHDSHAWHHVLHRREVGGGKNSKALLLVQNHFTNRGKPGGVRKSFYRPPPLERPGFLGGAISDFPSPERAVLFMFFGP